QIADHVVEARTEAAGMDARGVERDHAPAGARERHEPVEDFGRAGAERDDGERPMPVQAPAQQIVEDAPAAAKPPVPLFEVGVALREPVLHPPHPRPSTRSERPAASPASNPTRARTTERGRRRTSPWSCQRYVRP